MTFLVGSHNHLQSERFESNLIPRNTTGGMVFHVGRQLLEARVLFLKVEARVLI